MQFHVSQLAQDEARRRGLDKLATSICSHRDMVKAEHAMRAPPADEPGIPRT